MTLREDRMFSAALGLELVVMDENLRFWDPVRDEWLRTYAEAEAQRLAESRRANTEAQRAEAAAQRADAAMHQLEAQRANNAEAENARLRAELETLRQRH